jgi:hypothetical protein
MSRPAKLRSAFPVRASAAFLRRQVLAREILPRIASKRVRISAGCHLKERMIRERMKRLTSRWINCAKPVDAEGKSLCIRCAKRDDEAVENAGISLA